MSNKQLSYEQLEHLNQVRFKVVDDLSWGMEDLKGDCYDPGINKDVSPEKLKEQEIEFERRVSDEGVHGIVSEYWDGTEWCHADSCYGFVGGDWKGSGYDDDARASAVAEYYKQDQPPLLVFANDCDAAQQGE